LSSECSLAEVYCAWYGVDGSRLERSDIDGSHVGGSAQTGVSNVVSRVFKRMVVCLIAPVTKSSEALKLGVGKNC
jgi:hypothetical protein